MPVPRRRTAALRPLRPTVWCCSTRRCRASRQRTHRRWSSKSASVRVATRTSTCRRIAASTSPRRSRPADHRAAVVVRQSRDPTATPSAWRTTIPEWVEVRRQRRAHVLAIAAGRLRLADPRPRRADNVLVAERTLTFPHRAPLVAHAVGARGGPVLLAPGRVAGRPRLSRALSSPTPRLAAGRAAQALRIGRAGGRWPRLRFLLATLGHESPPRP
jgi:hypothetical protein